MKDTIFTLIVVGAVLLALTYLRTAHAGTEECEIYPEWTDMWVGVDRHVGRGGSGWIDMDRHGSTWIDMWVGVDKHGHFDK